MFFMIGVSEGSKEFDFTQTDICRACGRYGRYIVFMTYTVLSLFFIPTFRWNKQYYVRMSCCGKIYRLNPEVGKRIASGEDVRIQPEDLEDTGGYSSGDISRNAHMDGWSGLSKTCEHCGYTTNEDFDFCPKCGKRF